MASSQDTNSDSRTNSLTNTSNSQNDDDFTHMELKGWLMKRSKMARKWKRQWFLLKNTDLCYGDKPEVGTRFTPTLFTSKPSRLVLVDLLQ